MVLLGEIQNTVGLETRFPTVFFGFIAVLLPLLLTVFFLMIILLLVIYNDLEGLCLWG